MYPDFKLSVLSALLQELTGVQLQVQLQQVHTAAHAARRTLRSSLQSARGLCSQSRGQAGHTHRLRFTLSRPAVES